MTKDKRKKREKKTNIIWFICLLIFILATSLFISIRVLNKKDITDNEKDNNQNENIIYNTNKDVINDKEIDNVKFTNIECYFDEFNSLLSYTITNNNKNSIILGDYELIVKDKDNNILAIMVPGDTKELKSNESIDIENIIDIDLTKAYKLELNKIK